jgi:hypothetical protein
MQNTLVKCLAYVRFCDVLRHFMLRNVRLKLP